jgi:hypothetical protein
MVMQTSDLEGVDTASDPLHQTVPQLDQPQHPSSRALTHYSLLVVRGLTYLPLDCNHCGLSGTSRRLSTAVVLAPNT